jgi:hypothetical protein
VREKGNAESANVRHGMRKMIQIRGMRELPYVRRCTSFYQVSSYGRPYGDVDGKKKVMMKQRKGEEKAMEKIEP